MEPSARALEAYLDQRRAFDDIGIMLFSHGVDSVGLASIERWRSLLERAHGSLIGVDPNAYPRDFGVFVRYHYDLRRKFRSRYPIPAALSFADLDRFVAERGSRYAVTWS
jgi:hypothetical protein